MAIRTGSLIHSVAVAVEALLLAPIPLLAGDAIDKLVQRKLTPGAVALLVQHVHDPRVAARLKTALSDKTAVVRAVAARVTVVGRLADLLPDLKSALAAETDPEAAREEMRAVCTLGGPAADTDAFAQIKRFSGRLDGAYVRVVGRLRGTAAIPAYFSTLRPELSLTLTDRRAFYRRVFDRSGADALVVAGSYALSHEATEDWQAIVAVAGDCGVILQESILLAALRAEDAVLRGEAAWYSAKSYRIARPGNRVEILKAADEGARSDADPERRFGFEMLGRVLGKAAVEDEAWIACLETNLECHLDSDFVDSPLDELLTERERMALRHRNEANRPREARSSSTDKPPSRTAATSNLQLVTGLPHGTASDLLSVGGCLSDARRRYYAVGEVDYGSNGFPIHVKLVGAPSNEECQNTAATIFLLSTASEAGPVRMDHGVLLALFDENCLLCNEEPAVPLAVEGSDTRVLRVRANIVPPRIEKKDPPIYPEEARKNHQEGVSIYEAIISSTGCVRDIQVRKSSYPLLDMVGMEALARWRYKPATLNGQSVTVYLTVTITYNLGR